LQLSLVMLPLPRPSPLFPYTTLFRSSDVVNDLAGNARPVEIKLFGPDLAALEAYGTRLDSAMAGIDGLEDLFSGVSEPTAEMARSEEHTSELQSRFDLVCRLLLEKKK